LIQNTPCISSLSRIARIAGAPKSEGAGIYLYKHVGEKVAKKEKIYTVYSESRDKLRYALEAVNEHDGFEIE
jgi:thymidine phosphorylase